jgi:hypothetical protein
LVSEPKHGVDAVNKVTENQPNDYRCGGNAVMVGLCRKNQDEEKGREEGKNGELDTHGAGEFLKSRHLKQSAKGRCVHLSHEYVGYPGDLLADDIKPRMLRRCDSSFGQP